MSETNYWRINGMLHIDLAVFLGNLADCARCPMLKECKSKSDCVSRWITWLESEAE